MLARAARLTARSGARGLATRVKNGLDGRVCAVLGGQWGDEGKGKLVDVLAKNYDLVARFNGGANAGHTVIVGKKKYAFHLLPSGLIYPHTKNLLGNGVVVDLEALFDELVPLEKDGISAAGRLFISDRAHLLISVHRQIDKLMEDRRSKEGKAIGTTKKGIGPCYTTKAARMGVPMGLLLHRTQARQKVTEMIRDLEVQFQTKFDIEAELAKLDEFAPKVQPMIVNGVHFVNDAYQSGKRIITEGANAAMLDLDFGTYPFVTSSSTTVGGVCTGLGLSPDKIDSVMGVFKAYTTRVGGGPFPTELTDSRGGGERPDHSEGTDIGLHMQTVGAEIGVTTGRKRRCGWFDAVVAQYSHTLNSYSSLNLTKLDVLDELDEVKIGVAYEVNGQRLPRGFFPSTLEDLKQAKVIYKTLPGWKTQTRHCRTIAELPKNAQAYVKAIEEVVGVPVTWIGVGPGREEMATAGFSMK